MTRFDPSVIRNDPGRRSTVVDWLEHALQAVEPEKLTRDALRPRGSGPGCVIAIGKAAPAMVRGAAEVADVVDGICVSANGGEDVPPNVECVVGDHPVPGPASMAAGEAVLRFARDAPKDIPLVALISGGGSSLCEAPRSGVSSEYLKDVTRRLLASNLAIERVNLVRSHLSRVKCGGVARAAGRPIDTFVISDVAGAEPQIVASDDPH